MQYYFLLGQNIMNLHSLQKTKSAFLNNGHTYEIYGDAKNKLDCATIILPEDSHIIIFAHGNKDTEFNYKINLCSLTDNFVDSLQEISKNQTINAELFSCYGGLGIHDISSTTTFSTLITLDSPYRIAFSSLMRETLDKSLSFMRSDNPFIKFASYIYINPDNTQFAIKSNEGIEVFISSINSLANSLKNSVEIIEWQDSQLDKFLEFCSQIYDKMNSQRSKQIIELLELFKDPSFKEKWSAQFDIKRYQELLLINMSNAGKLEFIQKILELGVNINAKLEDGSTSIYVASSSGATDVVKWLIKSGAALNEKTELSTTPLLIAINDGHIDIVKALIKAGAPVNKKDNLEMPLSAAAFRHDIDMVKALIEAGAPVNEEKNGRIAIEMLFLKNKSIDIIKLLLAAGSRAKKTMSFNSEIAKEFESFNKSPIKYILTHNDQAKFAFNAMKALEAQDHFAKLLHKIKKTEDCLVMQPEGIIEDLNAICGKNGSYYDGSEL